MKKLLLISCLLLLSRLSFAQNNTGWVLLTEIFTGTDVARVNLQISGDIPNPAGCPYVGYLQVNEDSSNRDDILSIALMALAANREVRIEVASGGCSRNDHPRVRGIRVR